MRGFLFLLLAAGLLAAPPGAHRERIRVPVWVDSGEGQAALEPGSVTAVLGKVPATIGRLLGPEDDLMLLLVTDLAGDLALVDSAKRALAERIRELPPSVWVGLLRAQDGLRVLVDPTPDRELVSTAVQSIQVGGRAGLLESIQPAAALGDTILKKAGVRAAVLFVTDSDVRNYRGDFTNPVINESDHRDMSRRFPDALIRERISKLETALTALLPPVFIVHLTYRGEGLDEAYQAGLMRLASSTGGTSSFCRSQGEIPEAITRVLERIRSHYSLEVLVPEDAPKELNLTLEIEGKTPEYRSRFSK